MGIESYFLITLGCIGIALSAALVKIGYGRKAIDMLSKASRGAIKAVKNR
jgi:hypothetical protein